MRKLSFCALASLLICISCQESVEERAAREAKIYTETQCPTPFVNNTRTDSVVFDKTTRTYQWYCTFSGQLDDEKNIALIKKELSNAIEKEISSSTDLKPYKDAGFNFAYICSSQKQPQKVLYKITLTEKDYNK